jgi:Bacterial Ig-like domain (group 2)
MTAVSASRTSRARASIALGGFLLAACGSGSSPATPTATPPAVTVTALTVNQPIFTLNGGERFQLVATATLSDGRTATSGFKVLWASSDDAVATVNASGLVTGRGDGTAVVTATADAITASATFRVRAGGGTVTGLVTETAPRLDTPVVAATVMVVDGLYKGFYAFTDNTGRFALTGVNGRLSIRVTGYFFEPVDLIVDAGSSVVVRLAPVQTPGMIVDRIDWLRPSGGENVYRGELTFLQQHTGAAHLISQAYLYYSDSAPTCHELRDDAHGLLWQDLKSWQGTAEVTLTLTGGKSYTLKVFDCDAARTARGPTVSYYRLRAEHQ